MPTLFSGTTKTPVKTPFQPTPMGDKKKMGPLTSFAMSPLGVRFETQEEKEEVVLFLRQHIIVNVPWIILAFVLVIAPSAIFPFIIANIHIPFAVPIQYILVLSLFWYLITAGFILANFLKWFFNIYIVTTERVVDIDFYYLLFKRFSEAELEKIQDISYSSGGIAATVFNYGNVSIQTAGETPNLEFEAVPTPQKIVETIRSLTEQHTENSL